MKNLSRFHLMALGAILITVVTTLVVDGGVFGFIFMFIALMLLAYLFDNFIPKPKK